MQASQDGRQLARELLKRHPISERTTVMDEDRRAYRDAAAVLVSIAHPRELNPLAARRPSVSAEQALGTELRRSPAKVFEGKFVLATEARREALKELGPRQIRQALDANHAERGGAAQSMYEELLLGGALDPEKLNAADLEMAVQLLSWLRGLRDVDETLSRCRARLDLLHFLAPFEALAGDSIFVGRTRELDQLRDYVGVVSPRLLVNRVRAAVGTRLGLRSDYPALTVFGPGGVGKSTLISRFILEHLRLPLRDRIPLGYLDFDRPDRDVADLVGLTAEIIRQVRAQRGTAAYDDLLERAQTLAQLLEHSAEPPEEEVGLEDPNPDQEIRESRSRAARPGPIQVAQVDEEIDSQSIDAATSLLSELRAILAREDAPAPLVLILDSFEEVQYRNESRAHGLWKVLQRQEGGRISIRTVISGRAPVHSLRWNKLAASELEIGEFDAAAAQAFLRLKGITDPDQAEAIVRLVGGVPLSLVLAATLLKKGTGNGPGLDGVSGKKKYWFSAADEVIQGQLYDRILGHIHDERLKALAHPGLVLRRITPDVIRFVLNEPCRLRISSSEDARELFDELKKETSLVSIDDSEGAVVHRRDLRAVMLGLIVDKQPETVKEIHRAAADWYSKQPGLRARAEECYHRLQLGGEVSRKWMNDPEVRASIQASINDFSSEVQEQLLRLGFVLEKRSPALDRASEIDSFVARTESALPYGPRALQYAADAFFKEYDSTRSLRICVVATRVFAQLHDENSRQRWMERADAQAPLEPQPRNRMEYLSEKCWDLQTHQRCDELVENGYLHGLLDHANRLKSKWAYAQHALQSMLVEKTDTALRRAGASAAVRRLDAHDLWNIFPAFGGVAERLREHGAWNDETWEHLVRILADAEGPFARAEFSTTSARAACRGLVETARDLHRSASSKEFSERARELLIDEVALVAKKWPYSVLRVEPPYGSSGAELYESAA